MTFNQVSNQVYAQSERSLEQLCTLVRNKYVGPCVKWKRENDKEIFEIVFQPVIKTIVVGLIREVLAGFENGISVFNANTVASIFAHKRSELAQRSGLNPKKIGRWFEAVKNVFFGTDPSTNPLVGGISLVKDGRMYSLKLERGSLKVR